MSKLPELPGTGDTIVVGPAVAQPINTLDIESCNGDPLLFLSKLMDHPRADIRMRLEAAKTLMPFKYAKLGETGKKEQKDDKAKQISGKGSKYGSLPQPGVIN